MLPVITLVLLVFLLSYLGTYAVRFLAHRHDILDVPNHRSSHDRVVPRGGGLVIVIATIAGIWLHLIVYSAVPRLSLLMYTVGAILIVAISGIDDWRSQPASVRFAIHSLAAVLAILGVNLQANETGISVVSLLSSLVMFFWIVGFTNAYNFMDGIDGIAGGQALVAGICWVVLGWLSLQPLVITAGVLLTVSSLGFLLHNWHPARIFMGDVGSAFLGYSFAVLPLLFEWKNDRHLRLTAVLPFILPLWPFIFDSTFTFMRRLSLGENVFAAHRSHLYQRLVIAGYGHRFVSSLYSGLALLGLGLALVLSLPLPNMVFVVGLLLPVLCFALWSFVTRAESKVSGQLNTRQTTFAGPM